MKSYLIDLAVAFLCITIGALIGASYEYNYWKAKTDKAELAAQQQLQRQESQNTALASAKATSDAQIAALQDTIAHQLPKVEKVYVYIRKPSSPTTAAPAAVTEPLYITAGLVGLYNQSLGLPGAAASAQSDDAAAALPSDFTLTDYFSASLHNDGICLTAAREVTSLQDWIRGLNARQ